MESATRKVNSLLTAFLWFIALVCLALPAWLLYNSWNKGRLLNERLENCDDSLLTDSGVKIIQVMSAPLGTTCLLYTSPSPRDGLLSRMPSSA